MKVQFLVPGHTLVREGAPHAWNGKRYEVTHLKGYGTSGEGKGLCSCGATSPVLTSGAARQKWHRAHKEQIAAVAEEYGWLPERVHAAMMRVTPFADITTWLDKTGTTQVSMSFDELCSFVETICGSMSEQDLLGFVKQELARYEGLMTPHEARTRRNETGE